MKIYAYNHDPIPFDFKQTIDRFFVEEIPLFRFSGHGNNLILKIKKSDMSTWKLIHVLSKVTQASKTKVPQRSSIFPYPNNPKENSKTSQLKK